MISISDLHTENTHYIMLTFILFFCLNTDILHIKSLSRSDHLVRLSVDDIFFSSDPHAVYEVDAVRSILQMKELISQRYN
jgi:hypothetical protein